MAVCVRPDRLLTASHHGLGNLSYTYPVPPMARDLILMVDG